MESAATIEAKVTNLVTANFKGDWQAAYNANATAGVMSRNQLVAVLAAADVGFQISRGYYADRIIEILDKNNDGAISFAEFNSLARVVPVQEPEKVNRPMAVPSPEPITGQVAGITILPGRTDVARVTLETGKSYLFCPGAPGQVRVTNKLLTHQEFLSWVQTLKCVTVTLHPDPEFYGESFLTEFKDS